MIKVRSKLKGRSRKRIRVKGRILIRIRVKDRIRIRIRTKVKNRIGYASASKRCRSATLIYLKAGDNGNNKGLANCEHGRELGHLTLFLLLCHLCRFPSNSNTKGFLQCSGSRSDPPDPRVFWPPESGSGSTNQRYGSGSCSGSGFFYH